MGAGMASVMEKICSALVGNVLRKAQKNGEDRVSSSVAYKRVLLKKKSVIHEMDCFITRLAP